MNNIFNFGKRIELFLVNGNPDSIITAEMSNWNGKAIKIPRSEIQSCIREDLQKTGVYFLICKEDDGSASVYIGEAENIKQRLTNHIQDYNSGKESYYWVETIIFIGNDLNKASIRYLENRLVEIAMSAGRVKVLTKNTFKNTTLKESEISPLEEFIYNTKILINALGYKILEPVINKKVETSELLYLKTTKADAIATITNEGFVVLKGSTVSKGVTTSFSKDRRNITREKLIKEGIIKNLTFTQDYIFNSPSSAASIIRGNATSGPDKWINKDGKSLNDLQKELETSLNC